MGDNLSLHKHPRVPNIEDKKKITLSPSPHALSFTPLFPSVHTSTLVTPRRFLQEPSGQDPCSLVLGISVHSAPQEMCLGWLTKQEPLPNQRHQFPGEGLCYVSGTLEWREDMWKWDQCQEEKKIMEKMLGSWLYLNSRERKKGRETTPNNNFPNKTHIITRKPRIGIQQTLVDLLRLPSNSQCPPHHTPKLKSEQKVYSKQRTLTGWNGFPSSGWLTA